MAKFELKSDYQPMGDQPKAIAQLTDGLKNGVKEQTLLGVTGSGKSVVGSSKILIERNGSGQHIRIDKLNSIFTKKLPLDNDATQLVELEKGMLCTIALDTDSGKTIKGEVREISRHTYSGDLYTVQTSCGRENQFTDSHNVYVMRDGELKLLPSRSLRVGDWLPIPDKLPELNSPGIDYIDTREWLPEGAFYVSVEQKELIAVGELKQQKVWRVRNAGERVSLAAYNNMTVPNMSTLKDRVGSIKRTASVPVRIPVSRSLCKFLGLYIAEGHAEKNYITLTTADKSIAEDFAAGARVFGLRLKKRKSPYDYQISSKVLAALLKQLCGTSAGSKHLPSFWPSCSNAQLASLLSGVFAGDGWVENGSVCLASSSKELITDIQAALLRYGIHARSKPKRVVYRGIVRPSWVLRICGQDDLRRFQKHVSFGLSRKDEALAQQLNSSAIANTNVDVFPLSGEYLRVLCSQLNLYQRDIAKALGVSRSLISFYMSDQRRPSRKRAKKLIKFLLTRLAGTNEEKAAQKLTALLGLTEVFWSPISSIEAHTVTHEVVFDLAVPEYQTFFSGDGGYFVHNTFSMANIVQNVQKPTLVISHNKTLAAQLYSEFKRFFPNNAVHYFVSYFDYYQPEAYIPRSDTYIEKDSAINEEIDRLRHAATSALLSRRDVLIVASVSCIYGIGSVEDYGEMAVEVTRGERRVRDKFLRQLTDIQYQRNDIDFHRSTFRVRGDVVDIFPAGEEVAYRVEFFGDEIDRITKLDPLTGEILANLDNLKVFPGSHYVTPQDKLKVALGKIEQELEERLHYFKQNNQLVEAQRLNQRTQFDLEMLAETGFVKGIENYSRYLTNREPGEQPATLLDYFPDDYIMFVDESHMTIPQVRGMYNGDRARKEVLVEHGFRLPSALDNRPLTFTEFEKHVNKVIYVSATPAQYELSRSPEPIEQIIRPTGLLDPVIEVRPIEGQIDDLLHEIKNTINKGQRVLVTTLTKRMAEDLTEYLQELSIKVAYLHSDVDTLDRTDILRDLRLGTYDVLVGINLLREGLDLPEVSLVAILDADKEGFLRSEQALIQTVGRAARHVEGRVVMYADNITGSMQRTIDETKRRRAVQHEYNQKHGITPKGISKAIEKGMRPDLPEEAKKAKLDLKKIPKDEYKHLIKELSSQMDLAAANLEFEKAAELRDLIDDIKAKL